MLGHPNPETMARVLTGYIACDRQVMREVRAEFPLSRITMTAIAAIRAARNKPEPAGEPLQPGDWYHAGQASEALIAANAAFVARMLAERRRPRLRMEAAA